MKPFPHPKYLEFLEQEAISILRDTHGLHSSREKINSVCVLFSGGKDSVVLSELVRRAFLPCEIPFQFLSIDTGHNFPEVNDFIAQRMAEINGDILIGRVQDDIDLGSVVEKKEYFSSRNQLQSFVLNKMVREKSIKALIGGARRDEEKARSKERLFSKRTAGGGWVPESQEPELNFHLGVDLNLTDHVRVFPISNWTEEDVWHYIGWRNLAVPSIYFSHVRDCLIYKNQIWPFSKYLLYPQGDCSIEIKKLSVRCRTVGDMNCTGLQISKATTIDEVIDEIRNSTISERGLRLDDQFSETAMEDRKKEGYF